MRERHGVISQTRRVPQITRGIEIPSETDFLFCFSSLRGTANEKSQLGLAMIALRKARGSA